MHTYALRTIQQLRTFLPISSTEFTIILPSYFSQHTRVLDYIGTDDDSVFTRDYIESVARDSCTTTIEARGGLEGKKRRLGWLADWLVNQWRDDDWFCYLGSYVSSYAEPGSSLGTPLSLSLRRDGGHRACVHVDRTTLPLYSKRSVSSRTSSIPTIIR